MELAKLWAATEGTKDRRKEDLALHEYGHVEEDSVPFRTQLED